jgi:hypothetical protein
MQHAIALFISSNGGINHTYGQSISTRYVFRIAAGKYKLLGDGLVFNNMNSTLPSRDAQMT